MKKSIRIPIGLSVKLLLRQATALARIQENSLSVHLYAKSKIASMVSKDAILQIVNWKDAYFSSHLKKVDLWHELDCTSTYVPISLNFLKYVVSIHKPIQPQDKIGMKKLSKADGIIFSSDYVRTQQEAISGLSNVPTKVIPPFFEVAEESKKPEGLSIQNYLLFSDEELSLPALEVLVAFMKKMPIFSLVISAAMPKKNRIKAKGLIEDHKMQGRIVVFFDISDQEARYLAEHCVAFCYPIAFSGVLPPYFLPLYFGKPVYLLDHPSNRLEGLGNAFYWSSIVPQDMAATFQKGLILFNRDIESSQEEQKKIISPYKEVDFVKAHAEFYNSFYL